MTRPKIKKCSRTRCLPFMAALTILLASPIPAQTESARLISAGSSTPKGTKHLPLQPAPLKSETADVVANGAPTLSFLSPFVFDTDGHGGALVVADVNGDGKPDLIVSEVNCQDNYCGNSMVAVLLGNGNGTFQPAVTYPTGGLYASIAVEDVSGDGKLDIVAANEFGPFGQSPGNVSVLLGNGDGTFKSAVTYDSAGFGPASLAVADLNGDGKPDIVVANYCADSTIYGCDTTRPGILSVLVGNGDGTFQTPVTYSPGGYETSSVVVGDFNGDGKLDIAVSNLCAQVCEFGGESSVGLLLGNGDGTFQPVVTYDSGQSTHSLQAADLNQDNRLDLIAANTSNIAVLLGNGDGTFKPLVTYAGGGSSEAVADLNRDGKLDVLFAGDLSNPDDIGVLLGNGDGTLQPAQYYWTGPVLLSPMLSSVTASDLNGDGWPDIAFVNGYVLAGGTGDSQAAVMLNNTGSVPVPSATVLASSPNPSFAGQSVTLTAYASASAGALPDGEKVTFYYYGAPGVIGTASLSAGSASVSTPSLTVGTTEIVAIYNGDAHYAPSMSSVVSQVVKSTTKSVTSTTLASSLNPSIYGELVTWTATVTTSGSVVPTGKVTFIWSGHTIGGATLNSSGIATFSASKLNADSYPLTAVYTGDSSNLGSTSAIVNQIIEPTTSSAKLTSSANPSTTGQPVTFTARISSPKITVTGPVTFTTGKTILGTVELSNGKATFTTSTLATGSTVVTATFAGDSNIQGSSASVTEVVQQSVSSGSSSTTLTYTEDPSTLGEAFTATVTSASGTPSGTVTFTVGSTTLGTAAIVNGQATLNTTTLAVGSNTVTATYSGNSEIGASSAWVTQTFVMPVSGALYLQQEGGSAAATTTFGLGTSPTNFVPYYTGLPNNPSPTGELLVGTFPAGTLINFGIYTTYGSQSGYAFSTGTDQASIVSFADLSNSLGMDHGITQQTSPTTWLLHLDDALSYLYDDDNNDVLMELIVVPN